MRCAFEFLRLYYTQNVGILRSMNCPHCERLLYSRQHRTCGFCGGELPPEAMLEEHVVAELKEEQARIAARRDRDKLKDEEEWRKNANSGGADGFIFFG